MKLLAASSLLLGAHASVSVPYQSCASGSPVLQLSGVTANAWPPVKGKNLAMVMHGTISDSVDGGTTDITVTLDGNKINVPAKDTCELTKCPTASSGSVEFAYTQELPSFTPDGTYIVAVDSKNKADDTIFCIELEFKLGGEAQSDLVLAPAPGPSNPDAAPMNDQAIVDMINSGDYGWKAEMPKRFRSWTVGEAKSVFNAQKSKGSLPTLTYASDPVDVPAEFDARTQWPGKIGPILNQAKCGSCWAFGSAEAISDRAAIAGVFKEFTQLAPLDLVACDGGWNDGCQGGQPSAAWQYAQSNGLALASCMPYNAPAGPIPTCAPSQQPCLNFVQTPQCPNSCNDGSSVQRHRVVSDVYSVQGEQDIMSELATKGSVTAAFTVYADFPHYKSGVYKHVTGQALGGHAVKIIGYGTENGTDYWLVQNSWTTSWGAGGYFKIARGNDECGIEDDIVAGSV